MEWEKLDFHFLEIPKNGISAPVCGRAREDVHKPSFSIKNCLPLFVVENELCFASVRHPEIQTVQLAKFWPVRARTAFQIKKGFQLFPLENYGKLLTHNCPDITTNACHSDQRWLTSIRCHGDKCQLTSINCHSNKHSLTSTSCHL